MSTKVKPHKYPMSLILWTHSLFQDILMCPVYFDSFLVVSYTSSKPTIHGQKYVDSWTLHPYVIAKHYISWALRCRPVKFFHTKLRKPFLYGPVRCHNIGSTLLCKISLCAAALRFPLIESEELRSKHEKTAQMLPGSKDWSPLRWWFIALFCLSSLSEEFTRAVYVATGIKLTHHLVNTVFKIFDEDHDGKLSHKEFIGVMKDRLHRGGRVRQRRSFHCHLSHFYGPEGDRRDVPTRPTLLLPRRSVRAASHMIDKKESSTEVLVCGLHGSTGWCETNQHCQSLSGWTPQRAQTWTRGCKVKSALTGWRTTRQIWVDAEHRNTCLFSKQSIFTQLGPT